MCFLIFVLHTAAVIVFCYALWYDQKYVDMPESLYPADNIFKGRHKFLTLWNMVILIFTVDNIFFRVSVD